MADILTDSLLAQRRMEELRQLLAQHADPARLREALAEQQSKRGIPADEARLDGLVRHSIELATRTIHDAMLELHRRGKIARLPENTGSAPDGPRLKYKDAPARKRQLKQLRDAALSGNPRRWAKAWRMVSDDLMNELEAAALALDPGSARHIEWQGGPDRLPGRVPSPEDMIPLIRSLKGGSKGGRPDIDGILQTAALILDHGQFLSQRRSWGVDLSRADNFEQPGARLVGAIFTLYGFGKAYLDDEGRLKPHLLEDARDFRDHYAGGKDGSSYKRSVIQNDDDGPTA